MALRLYWNYPHLVARYQEVQLMLEAGLEVVCALDDLPGAEQDPDYHNERHPYYPAWRQTLTLPTAIAERVRRFSPFETLGEPSSEIQQLVNESIDIIYVGGDPNVVRGLGRWFEGTIFYRVMGFPNWVAQQTNYRRLSQIISAPGFRSRFVLAAGYAGLLPNRRMDVSRNLAVVNGWVEEQRTPSKWSDTLSVRHAVTAISYIHFHPYFQDQFHRVGRAIKSFPLRIVGKTDRSALKQDDPRILGTVPFEQLYSTIASARVFIDAGSYPNHLIWPPVEAALMGVPVLFVRSSGLVDPCRAAGYSMADMRGAGMFDTFEDIDAFLARHGDDIALLRSIATQQQYMFAKHTFSRDHAVQAFKRAVTDQADLFANPARTGAPRRRILKLREQARRETNMTQALPPLMLDAGENRWLMPQQMRWLKGGIEIRNMGRPTLVVKPGRDAAGQVIESYLPPIKAGWYTATLLAELYESAPAATLEVELGPWRNGSYVPERQVLHESHQGLVEFEFDLSVRPGEEDLQRELRMLWSGKCAFGVIGLRLDAAPYPDWLGPEHRP